MSWIYIRTPFGLSGDRSAIPNDIQPDGSVSQTSGFGINYQLDPATDPNSLNVPRDKFNEIEFESQTAIQQLQQDGAPLFITTSDNGGTPFSYKLAAVARYTGGWAGAGELVYYSLVAANISNPTDSTKWGLVQYAAPYFTGFCMPWFFSALPSANWVWLNGRTIGNAASNATGNASAITSALFTNLWNNYPVLLQLFTSAGSPIARGASAAADYAANRAIATPDMRGRGFFGADNMGGALTAGRITAAGSGISGTAIGAAGGVEVVELTGNQNGQHAHAASTASAGAHVHTATSEDAGLHTHGGTTNTTGSHVHGLQCSPGDSGFGEALGTDGPYTGSPNLSTVAAGDHQHTLSLNSAGTHNHAVTTDSAGAHVHDVTVQNSGLGAAHQNMPPAFIGGGFIMHI